MKPLPMSDSFRRRISRSSNFRPREKSDIDTDQTRRSFERPNQDFADSPRQRNPQFSTPNQQRLQYGSRPQLEAPSNFEETRQELQFNGVLDLEREERQDLRPNPLDKTAQRQRDVAPTSGSSKSSRYTSVPIDWSRNTESRSYKRSFKTTSERPTKKWKPANEFVWTAAR